jgi:hypothetical protein
MRRLPIVAFAARSLSNESRSFQAVQPLAYAVEICSRQSISEALDVRQRRSSKERRRDRHAFKQFEVRMVSEHPAERTSSHLVAAPKLNGTVSNGWAWLTALDDFRNWLIREAA